MSERDWYIEELLALTRDDPTWAFDPHVTTPDDVVVEAAADDLKHRLEHTGE